MGGGQRVVQPHITGELAAASKSLHPWDKNWGQVALSLRIGVQLAIGKGQ